MTPSLTSTPSRKRRLALLLLPAILGIALLLVALRFASPHGPAPLAMHLGVPADTPGLRLQVAHVAWDGPGVPSAQQRMADAVKLAWSGPGERELQRAGEAMWPHTGFRVVKIESFPAAVGRRAEFAFKPNFRDRDLPGRRTATFLSSNASYRFYVKDGQLYDEDKVIDLLGHDNGRKGSGIGSTEQRPVAVDTHMMEQVSDVNDAGKSYGLFMAYYQGAEEKGSAKSAGKSP